MNCIKCNTGVERGQCGPTAAHYGIVTAAPAVACLPAEPRRRGALEARGFPRPARTGEKIRCHNPFRRRSRYPLGLPYRHDLGTGRQDPVVRTTGARHSVNMLSAVTAKGGLRFMVHDGTVNSAVFIEFCNACSRAATHPSTWSWTVTRPIDPRPPASSPPLPTAGCAWSSYPATHPNSTPTNGSGRTSKPTASASQQDRPGHQGHLRPTQAAETPRRHPRILPRPQSCLHRRVSRHTYELISKIEYPAVYSNNR